MLYSGGMLCIVAALLMPSFENGFRSAHPELFDGVRGLLSGIGIGLMLWFLWRRRCCANSDRAKS
ncbi:MAG: hypothetical protein ACLGPM_02525 [Acidobacteriota bacterium]